MAFLYTKPAGTRGIDQTGSQDHREPNRRLAAEQVQLILHARDHGRRWDVMLYGESIVEGSRDPEHDAARVLASRGLAGRAETVDAITGKPRMRFDIERFAATSAVERAAGGLSTERWRPMPSEISAVRPQSAVSEPEGREIADEPEQASAAYRRRAA
jgi:hypothetical protein